MHTFYKGISKLNANSHIQGLNSTGNVIFHDDNRYTCYKAASVPSLSSHLSIIQDKLGILDTADEVRTNW